MSKVFAQNIKEKKSPLRENINLSQYSIEEKMKYIDKLTVWYPKMHEIINDISACHKNNIKDPECMTLFGHERVGKTYIVEELYYSKFQPYNVKDDIITKYSKQIMFAEITCCPVLYLKMPCPATIGGLVGKFLDALNYPLRNQRMKIYDQTSMLYTLLKYCRVELIILDEVQHLVDRDKKKLLIESSDWLKNLIDETKIPTVLVGTFEAEKIFNNRQLNGRFLLRHELYPFDNSALKIAEFRKILQITDDNLPLKYESNLSKSETWERLFLASNGHIPYLMKLIKQSAKIALTENMECIDYKILEYCYLKYLQALGICEGNPFSLDYRIDDALENYKPRPKYSNYQEATNKRTDRKKNKFSLSDL